MSSRDVALELAAEFGAPLGVSAEQVMSRSRSKSVVKARFAAMSAARERYGWSFPEIGAAFGRHHTTAMNAISGSVRLRKVESHIKRVFLEVAAE